MDGTKSQRILQHTEERGLQIRQLPGHDFANNRLFITPSAFRFMTFKQETIEHEEKVVVEDDNSMVSMCPKFYNRSDGTVWSSDDILNYIKRPDLHEVSGNGHSVKVRQVFAAISMHVLYFIDTTEKDDIFNVTCSEDCQFRIYELKRQKHFYKSLKEIVEKNIANFDIEHEMLLVQRLFELTSNLTKYMLNIISLLEANESVQNLVEINDMELRLAMDILTYLKEHNAPIMKPHLLEETDKGPGVSVSNFDVWFREAEKARLEKSDYRIRLHLATLDTCPADRVNGAIGDAVCDGGSLKCNYFSVFDNMSDDEISNLSRAEVQELEAKTAEKNAWPCCYDLALRHAAMI